MARPRVHLNVAASADGRLALADGTPVELSSRADLERVHGLRAKADAVLVGIGTVLADDPRLTARPEGDLAERQPLRVVLDTEGRTPAGARLLDAEAPTLIVAAEGARVERDGADVLEVAAGDRGLDLEAVLAALAERGIDEVLVEGGGRVAGSLLRAGLVDVFTVYVAPVVVGGDAPVLAPGEGAETPDDLVGLDLVEVHRMGEGVLLRYGGPS